MLMVAARAAASRVASFFSFTYALFDFSSAELHLLPGSSVVCLLFTNASRFFIDSFFSGSLLRRHTSCFFAEYCFPSAARVVRGFYSLRECSLLSSLQVLFAHNLLLPPTQALLSFLKNLSLSRRLQRQFFSFLSESRLKMRAFATLRFCLR